MTRTALIAFLCVLVLGLGTAYAYEFKLLNGMKVKGELQSFADGRFYVDTDFGRAVIDSDKLDYIIVEETDPGPSGEIVDRTPGIGFGMSSLGVEKVAPEPGGEAPPTIPCPQPLSGHSVAPAPLGGFSIGPATAYPGVFRGGVKNSVAPAPLGGFSIDPANAYPGLFRGGAK